MTYSDKDETNAKQTTLTSNTYVVRPQIGFASESDPNYLEWRYPDLFPFGRGGFGELRQKHISRKALVKHFLNRVRVRSTRQFQRVDFVLPVYDMLTRIDMSRLAFVRSILPSRFSQPNGQAVLKGETFGRVSEEDMELALKYKIKCAKVVRCGRPLPLPPSSFNGVAGEFFTDISIVSKAIQHSQAAAMENRQNVYAAHNADGKSTLWFTATPDDATSLKIVWYALGPDATKPFENKIPSGEFRFKLISYHPVAAALHFERFLNIVIERVIGWDIKSGKPFKGGGLFGVPKAWLRVVEEQSRLTLHVHFLIWIYGHDDIESQLRRALLNDKISMKINKDIPPYESLTRKISFIFFTCSS